jgi:hypothetical protein
MIWLDILLDRFRWYRRLRGGHWELWFVEPPVASFSWVRQPGCARNDAKLRPGMCHDLHSCEDWG